MHMCIDTSLSDTSSDSQSPASSETKTEVRQTSIILTLTRPLTVERLPDDCIRLIFEIIDGLDDAIMLALTSRRFWVVGKSYISSLREQIMTAWAGDRIICIGDYLRSGDWPSIMKLTPKNRNVFDREVMNTNTGRSEKIIPWTVVKDWREAGNRLAPWKLEPTRQTTLR